MALPFHLKCIAKKCYDSLTEATQVNLDLLKTAFLNRLLVSSTVDISVLTMALRPNEFAEEYYSRFMEWRLAKEILETFHLNERYKAELINIIRVQKSTNIRRH